MTAPVTQFSLGKSYRLYVGTAATGNTDSAYTQVVNENQFTLSYKVDNEKSETKAGGQITIPDGTESYELKGQADVVFVDPALATLIAARNQSWQFQIRNTKVGTVWMEGAFILNALEWKNEAKGVTSISFTMENAAPITLNTPERTISGS